MRFSQRLRVLLLIVVAGFTGAVALVAQPAENRAEPRPLLNPLFGDHMVLQRGKLNTFWGWAAAGTPVRVTLGKNTAETVAGADGRWQVSIEVPPAGGPYTVTVDGGERVVLNDVMVGDVWLCGGQSNMAFTLRGSTGGEQAAAQADHPNLRVFTVGNQVTYVPASSLKGAWKVCSPATAGQISAVAYYFARTVQEKIDVPIGLIVSAVGGSPAEAWIRAETLATTGEFIPQITKIAELHAKGGREHGSFLMHWLDDYDVGGQGEAWAKPDFDDRSWKTVPVPGGFAELGVPTEPAVVWFRREITLPDPLPAGGARIFLGVVERMDTVYLNGRWVGASSWVENPRVYNLPVDALKPGRNLLAIRVFKSKPTGGFLATPETLRIQFGAGPVVPLAGEWKAALSFDARPPTQLPMDFDNYPTMPIVLNNGMIAPLAPFALAGALWYQGEANSSRAEQYRKLLPALIADWRSQFGQGEFPFYIAGLPAFTGRKTQPGTDGWADLRGVQADTVRTVRNTGLAVTIDTGEANDIHPKEKRPVGERLALAALAGHYRQDVIAAGPTLRFVERRPGALALHFDHVAAGLEVRGESLGEFAVAGADRDWHWAQARLEGRDVVVVSTPEVAAPEVVSYAWQSNPLATLFNSAGLPAEPFRTDR